MRRTNIRQVRLRVTDTHTHTQTDRHDYRNPRCACAPRVNKVCRVLVHAFGVQRTSSNFLEPQHRSDNKVCTVLPQEFGVVRLCRTFSNLSSTGEARCAGCFCTRSGWFTYIAPPRTFSNHRTTELAGRVEVFHRRLERDTPC